MAEVNNARKGFTTGSCAAAASKAAALMLLSGKVIDSVSIVTPGGLTYQAKLVDVVLEEMWAGCGVIKDGGDDPDVTTGALIYSRVSMLEGGGMAAGNYGRGAECDEIAAGNGGQTAGCDEMSADDGGLTAKSGGISSGSSRRIVEITGGEGVGLVTKPGLDQPVGAHAINSVPRRMIREALLEMMELYDYRGGLRVEISVPGGEELARRTFNPRLGIEGGISIIGTTGIVEPMSLEAIMETIRVELRQKRALGCEHICITPGNYGRDYMQRAYGYDIENGVKCSNFIGDTIDIAGEMGFSSLLLVGHIGKLVKLAGGQMNTHSRVGDGRMELMARAVPDIPGRDEICETIMSCVVTEDAVDRLMEASLKDAVMERLMSDIMGHLQLQAAGRLRVECMMYSNRHGLLAKSEGALEVLELCRV